MRQKTQIGIGGGEGQPFYGSVATEGRGGSQQIFSIGPVATYVKIKETKLRKNPKCQDICSVKKYGLFLHKVSDMNTLVDSL